MESNGKSGTAGGDPVDGPTAPVTWGGVGTDAQHAVFQLLHQGTHLVPVEFLAVTEPGHALDMAHHRQLQIGRASGRERVCQYVSISGCAVSLKKNNKTLTTRQQ